MKTLIGIGLLIGAYLLMRWHTRREITAYRRFLDSVEGPEKVSQRQYLDFQYDADRDYHSTPRDRTKLVIEREAYGQFDTLSEEIKRKGGNFFSRKPRVSVHHQETPKQARERARLELIERADNFRIYGTQTPDSPMTEYEKRKKRIRDNYGRQAKRTVIYKYDGPPVGTKEPGKENTDYSFVVITVVGILLFLAIRYFWG